MTKLVNYKKRSFTLPAGCKDLMDVLEPSRRLKAQLGAWMTAPRIRNEHFHTAGLAHVGEYISKLLKSSANFFTLMITHRDDHMPVVLLRNRRENLFAITLYEKEAGIQSAIKAFFVQEGIDPLLDYSGSAAGGPEQLSRLIYPLPLEGSSATALTTGMLRAAYGLSDVAGLDFRYYGVETEA